MLLPMTNISQIKQNISTSAQKRKVFVGMSGGVDSSVSAALLVKAGYDVTGVFIKVWQPDWIECTWRDERREAMRVAAHLGIPFVTLDLEKEYKEGVIYYMIAEYSAGRTPNPDVMCNREVKFGAFWRWASKQGADYVATGHYSRVSIFNDQFSVKSQYKLLVGVDKNKDQSYFLWTLNQGDLKHVMFPVGHLEKSEVRKLAKKFKLPNADKKDSQGLCFIGKIDVKDFLAHYIETKPGKVLNEKGEVIGNHEGALLITIGERRGFRIDSAHKTPNDDRYYVVSKNVNGNTITVTNKDDHGDLSGAVRNVSLDRVNWVSRIPSVGEMIQARSRYRQTLYSTKVVKIEGDKTAGIKVQLEFIEPQSTITPGQSLVMYGIGKNSDECLGGGIIE